MSEKQKYTGVTSVPAKKFPEPEQTNQWEASKANLQLSGEEVSIAFNHSIYPSIHLSIIYLSIYLSIYLIYLHWCQGVRSPGTGVTDGCELPFGC